MTEIFLSRNLNRDEITLLALEMDLPTLLRFCETSKKVKALVCDNDKMWYNKLLKDFPNYKKLTINAPLSFRDIYYLLYKLVILKDKLKLKPSIYTIYTIKNLHLSNQEIIELPKEIGILINLEHLYLANTKLTKLPIEIGNLINLQTLDLSSNYLSELPGEIGNLINLENLDLHNNKLLYVPTEMGFLFNLKHLNLSYNLELKRLPFELGELKARINTEHTKINYVW